MEIQHILRLKDVTQIQASRDTFGASFAAVRSDGRVVSWGVGDTGGDSSAVRSQLTDVLGIQATRFGGSFAALKADGSVVSWGNPSSGRLNGERVRVEIESGSRDTPKKFKMG